MWNSFAQLWNDCISANMQHMSNDVHNEVCVCVDVHRNAIIIISLMNTLEQLSSASLGTWADNISNNHKQLI